MKNIASWIDKIIEDLVNPQSKLSDILLQVQVLAFKIENDKLKTWTINELNGFAGKERPDYRRIPCNPQGNLVQNTGLQVWTKNNFFLPVEYLDEEYWKQLMSMELDASVSQLEKMVEDGGHYQVNIPHAVYSQFNKVLDPWFVDSAWLSISINSIEGILSKIKSTLLNFLLELHAEFGSSDNLSIMEKKKEVGKIFDKTIGNIEGKNINISIGDKSVQSVNHGEKSSLNVAAGDSISQVINPDQKKEIQDLISLLNDSLDELGLSKDESEDIQNEISRVDTQLRRETPRITILESSLQTIQGILSGITANAYTPVILDKLSGVMSIF